MAKTIYLALTQMFQGEIDATSDTDTVVGFETEEQCDQWINMIKERMASFNAICETEGNVSQEWLDKTREQMRVIWFENIVKRQIKVYEKGESVEE